MSKVSDRSISVLAAAYVGKGPSSWSYWSVFHEFYLRVVVRKWFPPQQDTQQLQYLDLSKKITHILGWYQYLPYSEAYIYTTNSTAPTAAGYNAEPILLQESKHFLNMFSPGENGTYSG